MSDPGKKAQIGKIPLDPKRVAPALSPLKKPQIGKLPLDPKRVAPALSPLKKPQIGKLPLDPKRVAPAVSDPGKTAQVGKMPLARRSRLLDMELKGTIPVKTPPPKLGAARVHDYHSCPATTSGVPHVGGPILPPCEPTVLVNRRPHARVTDNAKCKRGPIDTIVTGSASVFVGGKNATRATEKSQHGGKINPPCSHDTFVGGPSTGCTLGDPAAAKDRCEAIAASRTSNAVQQSYGNCGIESTRQIIDQSMGGSVSTVSEDDILDRMIDRKWAIDSDKFWEKGGTTAQWRKQALTHYSIGSELVDNNWTNVEQALGQGKGVITSHNVRYLWNTTQEGGHAIVTTGIKYDKDGNATHVYINDTGTGKCGQEMPVEQYKKSLNRGRLMNITKKRIW